MISKRHSPVDRCLQTGFVWSEGLGGGKWVLSITDVGIKGPVGSQSGLFLRDLSYLRLLNVEIHDPFTPPILQVEEYVGIGTVTPLMGAG